jgi:ribose transport system substrate-binding protein
MKISKSQADQRHRSIWAVAVVLSAVSALPACGAVSGGTTDSPTTSGSLRPVKLVTYVNPLPSYPDFNTIGQCAKSAAEKNGWKYNEVGVTGTSVDNQASTDQISQAVAAGTDGLVVVPLDTKVYTAAIKQARSKGVYVVAAGTGDPSTGQQSQAGTSGTELGKLEADSLGAKDPAAVVGFLSQGPDQQIQVEAINGFKKEAQEKFPKMTLSASQYDNGDATKVVDIVRNMLAGNRDITALYVLNGASLAPAATAAKEAGKQGILIIGHDVTDVSRGLIESGKIYGVAQQGWCDMGTKAVDAIGGLSTGKQVEAFVPTEITFVTKDNLPAK